jgi:hypothetical protein
MLIHSVKRLDTHFAQSKPTITKKKFLRRFLTFATILVLSFFIVNLLPYSDSSLDGQLKDFQSTSTVQLFVGVL